MTATAAGPIRSRPQTTTVAAADAALLLLIAAGYVFPKLTAHVAYWPLVLAAAAVLIPLAVREYALILSRLRRIPRRHALFAASFTGAIFPAVGAVVLSILVTSMAAAGGLWHPHPATVVFYVAGPAAIAFLLSVLTATDDRLPARRRARGLCPHCGYDLRAHLAMTEPGPAKTRVICPECGQSPQAPSLDF